MGRLPPKPPPNPKTLGRRRLRRRRRQGTSSSSSPPQLSLPGGACAAAMPHLRTAPAGGRALTVVSAGGYVAIIYLVARLYLAYDRSSPAKTPAKPQNVGYFRYFAAKNRVFPVHRSLWWLQIKIKVTIGYFVT